MILSAALKPFLIAVLGSLGVACASAPRTPAVPPPTRPLPAPERVFSRAEAAVALDSLVAQPAFRTASWGILVVHPASGDTLFSHNAAQLLVPASNTKIVTGAVALARR
jgi:D-alanyl-D-alanine carboxypeptidase/D-alanyl-D-alanine-endopeptidase (penicillin-binding protein 4)